MYYSPVLYDQLKTGMKEIRSPRLYKYPESFGPILSWMYTQDCNKLELPGSTAYFAWTMARNLEIHPLQNELVDAIISNSMLCDDVEYVYRTSKAGSPLRNLTVALYAELRPEDLEGRFGKEFTDMAKDFNNDLLRRLASKERIGVWDSAQY